MGKRWTPEEEKVMAEYYLTAETVQEVADMLGRPVLGVYKQADKMGLKRSNAHAASMNRLKSILSEIPRSTTEIADLMNISRTAVSEALRIGHKEGLCHIVSFRASRGRGKDAPLWIAGPGTNATNDFEIERKEREARRKAHAAVPFKPFRDPLVAAFFGAAA